MSDGDGSWIFFVVIFVIAGLYSFIKDKLCPAATEDEEETTALNPAIPIESTLSQQQVRLPDTGTIVKDMDVNLVSKSGLARMAPLKSGLDTKAFNPISGTALKIDSDPVQGVTVGDDYNPIKAQPAFC